jgi:uncharacterized protein YjbJ (UPF0337 family)
MNKDQVKGRLHEAAGRAKVAAGEVLHDSALKNKGLAEQAAGKARAAYGDSMSESAKKTHREPGKHSVRK